MTNVTFKLQTAPGHRVLAMERKPTCLCCGHPLLRHARWQGIYWFCPHCYQEMPVLEHQPHPWKDKAVIVGKALATSISQRLKQPA